MTTNSSAIGNTQLTIKTMVVNGSVDGTITAETAEQARQAMGLSENAYMVTASTWCGNQGAMHAFGPIVATTCPMNAAYGPQVGDEAPPHQVLVRSPNPRYREWVGDVLEDPCLGLAFVQGHGLRPTAALVLLGEEHRLAMCFDPFKPTYRRMLAHWKLTGKLCVRFENPQEGYSCAVFEAREEDAEALDYLLALKTPRYYKPDILQQWHGMQAMEHRQLDPNTLFLLLLEEGEMTGNAVH